MATDLGGFPATMSGKSLATILNLLSAARIDARVDDTLSANANDYTHVGLSTAVVLKFTDLGGADRILSGIQTGTLKRVLVVWNADQVQTLTLPDQATASADINRIDNSGTDINLLPNQAAALEYNVSTNRWNCAAIAYPYPAHLAEYIIALSLVGQYGSSELLVRHKFADLVSFPANMASSEADAGSASTGTAVISLQKNGVEFGTITFTSSAVGVIVSTAVDFVPGDIFTLVAPSPSDATLADLALTFVGTKPFN